MSLRIAVLGLAAAAAALAAVPSSGAALTSESQSRGAVGSSPDFVPPTVAVEPAATVYAAGTTTLTATAADTTSTVVSVRLEVRPAGSTGTWTPLCTDTTAPYSCAWDTAAVADGSYDVRAVATDAYDNTGTSAVVQRVVDNRGPAVAVDEATLPDYLRGTATVGATASDAGSGVASVRISRSTDAGRTWVDLCTDTSAPYTCAWVTGSYTGDALLRAVATDVAGAVTTSAAVPVSVDNTPPTVSMASPGSPLAGTVTLSATAADADSGVASVLIEQRASSTSPWVAVCTDTTAPYSCRWDTTQVPDGTTYSFRATATDAVGSSTVSPATTTSTVDNRVASVSVEDPGAFLRGSVALLANANAPGGVASVAIQYAASGTTGWTTVCTDTTSPYSCTWDTTRVGNGSYDLRALMTPVSGSVLISAVVSGRTVDNSILRAVDAQATNGGTLGRVDPGDALALTYSTRVNLESVSPGWTGSSRAVTVRVRDGSSVGGVGGEDVLDVLTTTGGSVPLGTVNLRGNYVKGQALTLNATMTADTVTVAGQPATRITLVLGSLTSNDTSRVARSARTMTWSPSAAVRDMGGAACSVSPADEVGALDRDF